MYEMSQNKRLNAVEAFILALYGANLLGDSPSVVKEKPPRKPRRPFEAVMCRVSGFQAADSRYWSPLIVME